MRSPVARFDSASGEGVASAWDGFGRLVSSSIDLDGQTRTLAYQYDSDGNRTRITHPDGASFSTSYDGLDRPEWLTDPYGSALAGFAYAAAGTPSGVGRPGATSGLQFGPDGALISLSYYLGPAASLDVNWIYARNPAGQIASIGRDNDAYAWTGAYTVSRPYTTNGLNQYTLAGPSPEEGASFAYDANGNLVSDNGRAFGYDVENRLISAAPNVSLRYDPLGRLYQVATGGAAPITFLYDGDALVAEYAGATLLRRYVHGSNAGADDPLIWYEGAGTAASDRRNLLSDYQGSIVAVSNNAGTRLFVNSYDEYGIPAATNSGRFQYTGQIWLSELGLYHYKARVYSPFLGRFLQVDPIGYDDQFNLYAYVGNDPFNRTDPSGKQSCPRNARLDDCPDIPIPAQEIGQQLRREILESPSNGNNERGGQAIRDLATAEVTYRTGEAAGRAAQGEFAHNPAPAGSATVLRGHEHRPDRTTTERSAGYSTARRGQDAPSRLDQRAMHEGRRPILTIGPNLTTMLGRIGGQDVLRVIHGDPEMLPDLTGQHIQLINDNRR